MNAKKEFLRHTNGEEILCASIEHKRKLQVVARYILQENYSVQEYDFFLNLLDFDIADDEAGCNILYTDGTGDTLEMRKNITVQKFCLVPIKPKRCYRETYKRQFNPWIGVWGGI